MESLFKQKVRLKQKITSNKFRILAVYSPDYAGGKYNKDGKTVYRIQNLYTNREEFKSLDDFEIIPETKLLAYKDKSGKVHWSTIPIKTRGYKRFEVADRIIEE